MEGFAFVFVAEVVTVTGGGEVLCKLEDVAPAATGRCKSGGGLEKPESSSGVPFLEALGVEFAVVVGGGAPLPGGWKEVGEQEEEEEA